MKRAFRRHRAVVDLILRTEADASGQFASGSRQTVPFQPAEDPWVEDDPIANSIHFGYLDAMAQVIAEKGYDF